MRLPRSFESTKLPDNWPDPPPRFRIGLVGSFAIAFAVLTAATFLWVAFTLVQQILQSPPQSLLNAKAELNRIASQSIAQSLPQRPARLPPPVLVVADAQPSSADTARRLDVALSRATAGAVLLVSGLMPGSTVSAGRAASGNRWRLSAAELATATITPPKGFVGGVDLMLELRLSDDSIADRKTVRLAWAPNTPTVLPPPPAEPAAVARQADPAEIEAMFARGQGAVAKGDLAAARLLFQRAAEAGDARAAFALAETYDPAVLQRWGEQAFAPDVDAARTWYALAAKFGSNEAAERLQALGGKDH